MQLMERDDYLATLVDFLELLPASIVVERISGDAPPDYFVGPAWCLDKAAVRLALEAEFAVAIVGKGNTGWAAES